MAGDIGKSGQKPWHPGNFRLRIDGLDCTRIARIESFTVKQTFVKGAVGEARDDLREPGKLEFPNLKITFGAASLPTWQDWFQDFVVAGINDDASEKRGILEFLAPDRQEVLASVEFDGLGIFRLEAVQGADAESTARYTAGLYCEKMAFIPGKSAP